VLAADVNLGYHDWRNWIVDFVNGEAVRDFAHFAELIKHNENEYAVMENKNGYQLVINHADALTSASEILARYRIPAAHSIGLFKE
jgi:hypothetical protein